MYSSDADSTESCSSASSALEFISPLRLSEILADIQRETYRRGRKSCVTERDTTRLFVYRRRSNGSAESHRRAVLFCYEVERVSQKRRAVVIPNQKTRYPNSVSTTSASGAACSMIESACSSNRSNVRRSPLTIANPDGCRLPTVVHVHSAAEIGHAVSQLGYDRVDDSSLVFQRCRSVNVQSDLSRCECMSRPSSLIRCRLSNPDQNAKYGSLSTVT